MPNNLFQSTMQRALRYTTPQQWIDMMLVLGESGGGKSALIAYLQGCRLKYNGSRIEIESCPDGVVPPKVGEDVRSETLFSEAFFPQAPYTFGFKDFAGFYGNRDDEGNLLEFMSTQVGVKRAPLVKAITIMLSFGSLRDPKSNEIMATLDIMAAILKTLSPQQIPMVQLVISHLPQKKPPSKTAVLNRLKALQAYVAEKLKTEDTAENQSIEKVLSFWTNEGEQHVLLFNPLLNDTRQALFTQLSNFPAINPRAFPLIGAEQVQKAFLKQMEVGLMQGQEVFDFLLSDKEVRNAIEANISHSMRQVSRLTNETQTLTTRFSNPNRPIIVHSPELDTLKSLIDAKTLEIQALDKDHKYGGNEDAVRTDMTALEARNEEVLYETKEWYEDHAYPGTDIGTVNHVHIVRTGPAYIRSNDRIKMHCKDTSGGSPGHIEGLKSCPSSGQLELSYYSPANCYGYIIVRFYMKYNEQPAVIVELEKLKTLADLIAFQRKLKDQYKNNQDALINNKKEQDAFTVQSSKNALQSAQKELFAHQNSLEAHHEHSDEMLQSFHEQKVFYQVMETFNKVIAFQSKQVDAFHRGHLMVRRLLNVPDLLLSDLPWNDAPTPFLHNTPYYVEQFAHLPHRFATHKIPARLSNQTADSTRLFDAWGWDPFPNAHPVTKKSLFTLRLFKEDKEAGSAVYYGQPQFCRSVNGKQHNIIETTGLLSEPRINASATEEICRMPIPPNVWDRVGAGALQGAVCGAVDVLGYALEAKQVSKKTSQRIQDLFYYGIMLWMRYTEHLAEEKSSTDALKEAIVETVLMYCMQLSFKLIDYIATRCEQGQPTYLSQGLSFFSRSLKLAPIAYNVTTQPKEIGAYMGAGILAQRFVIKTGREIVDDFRSNDHR